MDSPLNLDALTDRGRAIIEGYGRVGLTRTEGSKFPWRFVFGGLAILGLIAWNRSRSASQRSQPVIIPQIPPPQVTPAQSPTSSDDKILKEWDRIFESV